jgi:O-antigen ligase
MLVELRKLRFPVEFGLLALFCLFLPLIEAPKNLAWLAYCATWIFNRAKARDFGGRWDLWDTLIALWIASGFLVAAFAGLHQSEWRGAGDLLRYGSLLWLVKRAGYSERELRWLLGALVASTVLGLAHGYYRLLVAGNARMLQLHSVGHVNHTAIYLAIMLGVCASWIFARWKSWHAGRRSVAVSIGVLVVVSLVVTASRGAVGIGLLAVPVLAAVWWPRWRMPLLVSVAAVAVAVMLAVAFNIEVVRKQQDRGSEHNVLAFRDGMWNAAVVAWQRYPWFGVGMDNYSAITLERVEGWRKEAGKPYDATQYTRFPHGHSLFFNTLAERGAVGTGMLAAVLLAWLVALVRKRPRPPDADHAWLLWGSAAGALLVTAGTGAVNTTLHHEHGILATLLLGLWLSTLRDT